MSYTNSVTVRCDAKGCTKFVQINRPNRGGLDSTEVGRLVRSQLWWVAGGVLSPDPTITYCPDHYRLGSADA
jgi:hypothetical protein